MASSTDLDRLFKGNEAFIDFIRKNHPDLFQEQYRAQQPPFMFLGCSDSRVSEGTVFDALPGVLFTERNIANQFLPNDNNVQSALAFAINSLGVRHVIVMGHYNCGGCAAAMNERPPPPVDFATASVQNWIEPIRSLYAISNRPEIVAHRSTKEPIDELRGTDDNDAPCPALKALIEENVIVNVQRVHNSTTIRNYYARFTSEIPDTKSPPVFIHGFVYDLRNGRVLNLGVSFGPPGFDIPNVPFQPVSPQYPSSSS